MEDDTRKIFGRKIFGPLGNTNHYGREIKKSRRSMQITKRNSRKSTKHVENDHKRVTTPQIASKNTEIL
ncbi:hypothetical protein [Candidatus Nitrosocosmicus sp. T]